MNERFHRSYEDVVKAHDMLDALLRGEVPSINIKPNVRRDLMSAQSVLCWLLGHELGQDFQENLERCVKAIKKAGYEATYIQ